MIILYLLIIIILWRIYSFMQIETFKNNSNICNNKFIIFVPYCIFFKKYINKCINSIYNQNYDNYEIVIVNDGDDTQNFNKYKNKNLKILSHNV